MKTIGLLGGMSWESSIEYERIINTEVRAALGGTASADLIIRSYNFAEIEALQEADGWSGAAKLLADATADAVQAAGIATVRLLGTRYTMEHDFYRGRLEVRGIDVRVPDEPTGR